MPAGDLISADFQVELRATLTGDGTNYQLGPSGEQAIKGLGAPEAKTADVDLDLADGSYGSPDFVKSRVITVPYYLEGTPTQVGGWLKDLNTVWAVSTSDVPLYVRLPGFGKLYVNGRPRGLADNLTFHHFGVITALATFVALDPTIHYV